MDAYFFCLFHFGNDVTSFTSSLQKNWSCRRGHDSGVYLPPLVIDLFYLYVHPKVYEPALVLYSLFPCTDSPGYSCWTIPQPQCLKQPGSDSLGIICLVACRVISVYLCRERMRCHSQRLHSMYTICIQSLGWNPDSPYTLIILNYNHHPNGCTLHTHTTYIIRFIPYPNPPTSTLFSSLPLLPLLQRMNRITLQPPLSLLGALLRVLVPRGRRILRQDSSGAGDVLLLRAGLGFWIGGLATGFWGGHVLPRISTAVITTTTTSWLLLLGCQLVTFVQW